MDVLVPFDDLPWESPAPGVRFKAFVRGSQRVRLLEFSEGFEEADWCTRGHVFHVLEGSLTLRMRERAVDVKAGDIGFLAEGVDGHKAVLGPRERARLLLFEVL